MVHSRVEQKFDRVTITFVPTADERSFRHVPSTFNVAHRTYGWRHAERMQYMIVPKKISSGEIQVELFLSPLGKGKLQARNLLKVVEGFVKDKIETDWRGLKLSSIGRVTSAIPPRGSIVRGTIEEILGSSLEH